MVLSGFILPLAIDFFEAAAFFEAAFVFEALSLAFLSFYFLRVSLPLTVLDILFFVILEAFVSFLPCLVFLRIDFIISRFNFSPLTNDFIIFSLKAFVSMYRPILLFGYSTWFSSLQIFFNEVKKSFSVRIES